MIEGTPTRQNFKFSDDDVFALQELLNAHKAKVWNPNPVARYLPQPSLTEISAIGIVRTPTGGIPAMWPANGTGTGTGSAAADDFNNVIGTGTGTAIYGGERPGFADCEGDYLSTGTASGRLLNHPRLVRKGETVTVYNPSFEPIPGNVYLTVVRDGYGVWWPVPASIVTSSGGGGGGGNTSYFYGVGGSPSWDATHPLTFTFPSTGVWEVTANFEVTALHNITVSAGQLTVQAFIDVGGASFANPAQTNLFNVLDTYIQNVFATYGITTSVTYVFNAAAGVVVQFEMNLATMPTAGSFNNAAWGHAVKLA